MTFCPYCERDVKGNVVAHKKACAVRPEPYELIAMVEAGMTRAQIARKIGQVSTWTVAKWVREAGIYYQTYRRSNVLDLDLDPDLAPLFRKVKNKKGGCSPACVGWDVCHARIRARLWVCCERPETDEVMNAKKNGLFRQAVPLEA